MRRTKKFELWTLNIRSNVSANQRDHDSDCLSPSLTVLPATLFCPKGLVGKHEKGDLDEGHIFHQKWNGVRNKVGGVYFNYEERLLGEIIN